MGNTRADEESMRRHIEAADEHRKIVLKSLEARLRAEKAKKPRRPKPMNLGRTWAGTVNSEPVPQLPPCPSPQLIGPLRNSVAIGPIDPSLAYIFNG